MQEKIGGNEELLRDAMETQYSGDFFKYMVTLRSHRNGGHIVSTGQLLSETSATVRGIDFIKLL